MVVSAYNRFVGDYMRTHGGGKAGMKAAAAAWRSLKHGGALRGMGVHRHHRHRVGCGRYRRRRRMV